MAKTHGSKPGGRPLADRWKTHQPLRADDFEGFMRDRRAALPELIAAATRHAISDEIIRDDGDDRPDDIYRDADTPASTV